MSQILLVEDDVQLRTAIARALDGHHVEVVGTGAAALARTESNGIDLVLLDLGLPDRDPSLVGMRLCNRLRAHLGCGVPVIVISGLSVLEAREAGLIAIEKPFDPLDLRAVVDGVLRKRAWEIKMAEEAKTPWWASLVTNLVMMLIGISLILVAALVVQPADPTSDVWLGILAAGCATAGISGWAVVPKKTKPDERGGVRVDLLIAVVAGMIASLLIGCGHTFDARRSVDLDVKRGPPCDMRLKADGDTKCRVRGPERCDVWLDGVQLPPPKKVAPEPQS